MIKAIKILIDFIKEYGFVSISFVVILVFILYTFFIVQSEIRDIKSIKINIERND